MNAANKNFKLLMALKQVINIVEEEESSERRYWVNPFLQRREIHSLESHLLKDLMWDTNEYNNFCRMNIENFEFLLNLVSIIKTIGFSKTE